MIASSVAKSIARSVAQAVSSVSSSSGAPAFDPLDIATIFIDPAYHTYVERSGALNTLTPASVDGPVGTIADRSGTYLFRAPSDAGRMTLKTHANGKAYLEGGTDKYYTSDDAASTWKWLHDGTNYAFNVAYKFTATQPRAVGCVFGTYGATGTQTGVACYVDDSIGTHLVSVDIGKSVGGSFPILASIAAGVAGGRWHNLICQIDPDAVEGDDRCLSYSFGRAGFQNTTTAAPSTGDPTSTLILGALGGGSLANQNPTTHYGGWVFYQGTWTADNRADLDDYFDFDTAGRLVVELAYSQISNEGDAYEGFPTVMRLLNDDLVVFYRGSATHANTKGTISVARSSNNGASWSVTNDVISEATDDVLEPNGLQLPNGRILIGANITLLPSNVVSNAKVWASDDNGATFTEISDIAIPADYTWLYPFGNWHRLSDGTILAPMYSLLTAGSVQESQIWESDDSGVTWAKRSLVASGFNETSIYNLTGTTWLAVCRNAAGAAHHVISTDDCATWGAPVNTTLGLLQPQIFEVGDTVYVISGDRTGRGGVRLNVWTDSKVLGGETEWFLYEATVIGIDMGQGSVVVDVDGTVHLAFYDTQLANPGVQYTRLQLPDFGSI